VQLRDYQDAAIEKLRAGFREGHRVQVLYLPTGAGKTEIALAMADSAAKKYKKAAMVLDRIVLCDQTSLRMTKYDIEHGVMQSGHWRYRPYERIQVCSAQTLEKRGSFPGLNVLIVDECHAQRKQTLEFIKSNPEVRVVGLSATPFTKGLGQTYTNVVCSATTDDLVKAGHLVPLRVFIAKEIDMTGAKKVAGEWSKDEAGERGMKITGDVVSEWVKKTHEVYGGPRKTIVFCANVAHGADLAQKFAEAGYNFVAISYKDSDEYKREAVEDFSKPDSSVHGLIACDILTKGFDVPDVMIGVSARPFTKSLSSHIQQMGRVMRPCEGKEFALWLDHSGNYLRFREDWERVYNDGVTALADDAEKAKKEPTEAEKKEAHCPICTHLWPGNSDTCPHCGHVRERRNNVVALPGVMEELNTYSRAMKQAWWSGFLYLAEFRQKAEPRKWALAKYRDKFGVWPKGLHDNPEIPPADCVSWETSRRIAWAKSKRRFA
jgi:DNA repair protein RadD